ncbi:BLUF domain-containing protein [Thalassotalea ganghwensis]
MYLVRLIYASKTQEDFGPQNIENIIDKARVYNHQHDITGILCFSNKYFLQCLEGSRTSVNNLYHKILNDDRHKEALMLEYTEISERDFGQWEMGYVPDSSLTKKLNLRFSGNSIFDPFKMSGDSAHKLLLALRANIPVI